jgi:hypothetical protein
MPTKVKRTRREYIEELKRRRTLSHRKEKDPRPVWARDALNYSALIKEFCKNLPSKNYSHHTGLRADVVLAALESLFSFSKEGIYTPLRDEELSADSDGMHFFTREYVSVMKAWLTDLTNNYRCGFLTLVAIEAAHSFGGWVFHKMDRYTEEHLEAEEPFQRHPFFEDTPFTCRPGLSDDRKWKGSITNALRNSLFCYRVREASLIYEGIPQGNYQPFYPVGHEGFAFLNRNPLSVDFMGTEDEISQVFPSIPETQTMNEPLRIPCSTLLIYRVKNDGAMPEKLCPVLQRVTIPVHWLTGGFRAIERDQFEGIEMQDLTTPEAWKNLDKLFRVIPKEDMPPLFEMTQNSVYFFEELKNTMISPQLFHQENIDERFILPPSLQREESRR